MNREIFFQHIRKEPFSGRMTAPQVAGVEAILDACAKLTDVRWTAYILATCFHETAARMQPVREGLAKTDAQARRILAKYPYAQPDPETGQAYYGRGLEQLTHKANYEKMGAVLGEDLVNNPDLMLRPDIAARSLLLGMTNGLYTGKKLADYFGKKDDPVGARGIVNGTDRAALIAGYHHAFLAAIRAANSDEPAEPEVGERATPAPRYPEEVKPLRQSKTLAAQGVVGTGTMGVGVTSEIKDSITQAQDAAGQLAMYVDAAKWIFILLICAGVIWTIYERIKAHREGKR
jgi:hypothetical protein